MYFRRTTYVFTLLVISLVIYLFQYIDTENRKRASMTSERSNPFYNSSLQGFLFRNQLHIRQSKISESQSEPCKQIRRASLSDIHYQHWQVQQDGEDEVVVYSAFYDDRQAVGLLPWIRILGVRRLSRKPLWCHVWYPGKPKPFIVEVAIVKTGRNLPIQGYRAYSQNMFSCPLDNADSIPTHVSIATRRCGASSILLPIITPRRSDEWSRNLGACLHLNSGYFPPESVVEWMEISSMFGLSKVSVYNGSLHTKLDRVFGYYKKKGLVEIHQMPPPVRLNERKEVTIVSSISLNDCMLRNMYTYRFVVTADLNEILIPRLHSNYLEMLDHLDRHSHPQSSNHTYSFQNAYFFQQFPEDRGQPEFLRTMRRRYHVKPSAFTVGSKTLINPRSCKSIFNHNCFVRSVKKDFLTVDVDSSVALNHRYQSNCPFSRFRCEQYDRQKIQDNIMLKYREVLLRKVSSALRAIGLG